MVIAVRPEPTPRLTPKKLDGEEELLLTGSEAIAHALRLADVDIVAAYPIRPYDAVMQAVAHHDRQRQDGLRVHRRRGRALPVRDRQACQRRRRAVVRRLLGRGLVLCLRGASP